MKEYGGYLSLELDSLGEYYSGDDVIKLNSGRTAIVYSIIDSGAKKVYLPYFICNTVIEAIKNIDVKIQFYHIDFQFKPIEVFLEKEEYLVYVNYFGIIAKEVLENVVLEYKNIIIDNSQSFFSDPIKQIYNVYSCRKFFGVPDGAYVIKNNIKRQNLEQDNSSHRANFLFQAIEQGTNSAYLLHLKNEVSIGEEILLMSTLTEKILESINYTKVKEKRKKNFKYMNNVFKGINELNIQDQDILPMAYPLLLNKKGLKEYLISKKVYVPTLWKECIEKFDLADVEGYFSRCLVLLPIDQRYNEEDMKYISNAALEYINLID